MIQFGPGKDINLVITGKHLDPSYLPELRTQNDRAYGLWRRLYEQDQPGVLLADEVGKGKTYVALAVAFARLATNHRGHILVLTHSGHMARVWADRWQELANCVAKRWTAQWKESGWTARYYGSIDHLSSDASDGKLPHIAFASYETLKKYGADELDADLLYAALRRAYKFRGMRLKEWERKELVGQILEDYDFRRKIRPQAIPDQYAKKILACLDVNARQWKEDCGNIVEDILDHIQARTWLNSGHRFDLLIVDEAHKLEGAARHRVVTRLLRKRFEKCLLVTATPFALSVHQFRRRLLDFDHARGVPPTFADSIHALPLDDFAKAVAEPVIYPNKEALERKLRQHMVRAVWDHDRERVTEHWSADAAPETILPTLLLERCIDAVLQSGQKTHIASRRESLCSSWPGARASLNKSPLPLADRRWSYAFDAVVSEQTALRDPKLHTSVEKIVSLLRQDIKVVVFTQRLATSKALARLLEEHVVVKEKANAMKRQAARFRRHIDKVANWLDLDGSYAAGVVKVMAHSADRPTIERRSVTRWWSRHRRRLGDGDQEAWRELQTILGRGRRLPIVVRHDADTGSDERNVEKFNLPSFPLALIATPKAQEGIDLHHYCRHVVLFDLTWNPAAMEQRIGRVHRIGGIRKAGEKVTVVYCFQKGTYAQVMADRIQKRCVMMRVLLGAGQWLDADREIEELDQYRMTFPP